MTSRLIKSATEHPKHFNSNHIYVVKDKTHFYRVKVKKFESMINQCECSLIDIGSVKWYDAEQIFYCPNKYQIAPMAIRFSLHGLSDFKENRKVREIIASELNEKCVWAKIKTTSSEYYGQRKQKSISITLYDSPEKKVRINISSMIMEKLMAAFTPPKLLSNHTNFVRVSHISKVTGIIYCHVVYSMNDLRFINKKIESFVGYGVCQYYKVAASEKQLQTAIANNSDKLYLIYSSNDECWYRATILQLETDFTVSNDLSNCSVHCFLVDYGYTRCITLDNVFDLTGILEMYPYFAVATLLDGIQMTAEKIEILKDLLQPGDDVMVDVIKRIENGEKNKTKSITLVTMQQLRKYNDTTRLYEINQLI